MERRKIIVGLVTLSLVVAASVATIYQVNARFKKSTPVAEGEQPAAEGDPAKAEAKPVRAIAMVSDEQDAAAAPASGPTDPFRAAAQNVGGGFPVRQANDVQNAPPHDSAYNAAPPPAAYEVPASAPQQPLPGGAYAPGAPEVAASPAQADVPVNTAPAPETGTWSNAAPPTQAELVSVPAESPAAAPAPAPAAFGAGATEPRASLGQTIQEVAPPVAAATASAAAAGAAIAANDNHAPPVNSLRESVRPIATQLSPAASETSLPPMAAAPEPAPVQHQNPIATAAPAAPATSSFSQPQFASSPREPDHGADAGGAAAGAGTPGARQLEGPQSPSLTLEKSAPAEVQVGKPATFQLKVRNVGQAIAEQVVVHDMVPKGTRLIDTTPRASRSSDGSLAWELGSLAAGAETTIAMQLMPEQEGEIGSVATVTFKAQASSRSVSTKPQLVLEHSAPEKILIGETLRLAVRITNKGTGAATGLIVEEDVPSGLSHAAGRELEYEIGTLRPGEEKVIELALKAEKAGFVENVLAIRGEGSIAMEDRVKIEVVAPQLEVVINGPKVRYLERAATYAVVVANPGTAPAKEVELVTHLPKGLKFVSANQEGQYDPQTHAVFWSLAELPARQQGQVELTALPIEQGEQKLIVEGKANLGLTSQNEHLISVEGLAALLFEVTDLADPIEVGKDTVYQVKVTNQGSKNATNVQVIASLPDDLKAIAGEGPTRVAVDGPRAVFEAMPRLAPGENAVFKLQVRGLKSGDQRIRVQLTSDDLKTPVTKEESTRVYADE